MIIQGINVANLMTYIINEVACTMEYSWSNDFSHEDLRGYYENVQKEMSMIDFAKLTEQELKFLGFRKFSKDCERYLVPLWLLRCLPNGTKLVDIMGRTVTVGEDKIDNDVRFGCTAYELVQ